MNDKISDLTVLLPTIETPTLTKAELSELLFERLGLEPGKKNKGKSGHSVDAEVLETLAADHRVHGVAPDGLWMHVGDPDARLAAEARLSQGDLAER